MTEKTFITTKYYASDGREFDNRLECERYESETQIPKLYLYEPISDNNKVNLINYINLIKGQFDIIKNEEIRKNKILKMLDNIIMKVNDDDENDYINYHELTDTFKKELSKRELD